MKSRFRIGSMCLSWRNTRFLGIRKMLSQHWNYRSGSRVRTIPAAKSVGRNKERQTYYVPQASIHAMRRFSEKEHLWALALLADLRVFWVPLLW
jgi:hypothetical protein